MFACNIKICAQLQLRSYTSTRCDKKLDKALISLLCKTKTKIKLKEKNFCFKSTENWYRVTIFSLLFYKCTVIGTHGTYCFSKVSVPISSLLLKYRVPSSGNTKRSLSGAFAKNFLSTRSEWKRCQDCFKNHQPNDCPHKSSTCYKCKKNGHLKLVCKTKVLAKLSPQIGGEKEHVGNVFSCYQRIGKQIWIAAEVNDIKMQYQWDTGSTVSMVSLDGFCQLGSPECIPVNTALMTYERKPLDVKGQCLVQVKIGDQVRSNLPLIVVNEKAVAIPALGLLGLSLSYKMMEGLLLFKF